MLNHCKKNVVIRFKGVVLAEVKMVVGVVCLDPKGSFGKVVTSPKPTKARPTTPAFLLAIMVVVIIVIFDKSSHSSHTERVTGK